jgi:hypothetical protein
MEGNMSTVWIESHYRVPGTLGHQEGGRSKSG